MSNMDGLAEWLRGRAEQFRTGSFIVTAEKVERWAAAVEAAQTVLKGEAVDADGVPACWVCDGSGKVGAAQTPCHNTECPSRIAGVNPSGEHHG